MAIDLAFCHPTFCALIYLLGLDRLERERGVSEDTPYYTTIRKRRKDSHLAFNKSFNSCTHYLWCASVRICAQPVMTAVAVNDI